MLNEKKLPNDYQVEVVIVVVVFNVLNVSSAKVARNILSYEAWFHRKSNILMHIICIS